MNYKISAIVTLYFLQVIRYASTSSIVPLGANEDPCRDFTCSPMSYCVVKNGQAECACNPGFQELYQTPDEKTCVDIDECALRQDNCSPNAECVNQQGSFGCLCLPGFVGNGVECNGKLRIVEKIEIYCC